MCAILFYLFTFLYLFVYQQDLMMLTQQLCSNGTTHYHPVIGTLIIMIILALVQMGTGRILNSFDLLYALSYVPSFIILTALTGVRLTPTGYSFGPWGYMLPVSILLFAVVAYWLIRIGNETKYMYHYSIQTLIMSNMLCMIVCFLFTCTLSNHSKELHIQLKAERMLYARQYSKALSCLQQSQTFTPTLTMLTAYTLSNMGLLPEKLFTYPIAKGSVNLLPDGIHTRLALCPEGRIYHHVGIYTKQHLSTKRYLEFVRSHRQGSRYFADYYLVSLLLDKNLDAFVHSLPVYYNLHGALPTHYREALLLYTHLHTDPYIIFHSNIMDADFQDFQDLESQYPNPRERYTKMRDTYGNTYWFYYFYQ